LRGKISEIPHVLAYVRNRRLGPQDDGFKYPGRHRRRLAPRRPVMNRAAAIYRVFIATAMAAIINGW
jgi:hypothetical protein